MTLDLEEDLGLRHLFTNWEEMGEPGLVNLCESLTHSLQETQKNNFGRLKGVGHFCGGDATRPEDPGIAFETSPHKWIEQIELQTPDVTWDAKGRIEVARLFALGPAALHVKNILAEVKGDDWGNFRHQFLDLYLEAPSEYDLLNLLSSAKRLPGEILANFHVRLKDIARRITEKDDTKKETATRMHAHALLENLPGSFQTNLSEDEMKDPNIVYKKAIRYVKNNKCGLSDAEVKKEKEKKAEVFAIRERPKPKPSQSYSNKRCYSCKQKGHLREDCPTRGHAATNRPTQNVGEEKKEFSPCLRCGFVGHSKPKCKTRLGSEAKCEDCKKTGHVTKGCSPNQKCSLCNEVGHTDRGCRHPTARKELACSKDKEKKKPINL